jgi:hypothetical protein
MREHERDLLMILRPRQNQIKNVKNRNVAIKVDNNKQRWTSLWKKNKYRQDKGMIKSNSVEKVLTEYVDGWLCQDLFFYYFIDNS